jgi:hypothetical protein
VQACSSACLRSSFFETKSYSAYSVNIVDETGLTNIQSKNPQVVGNKAKAKQLR